MLLMHEDEDEDKIAACACYAAWSLLHHSFVLVCQLRQLKLSLYILQLVTNSLFNQCNFVYFSIASSPSYFISINGVLLLLRWYQSMFGLLCFRCMLIRDRRVRYEIVALIQCSFSFFVILYFAFDFMCFLCVHDEKQQRSTTGSA